MYATASTDTSYPDILILKGLSIPTYLTLSSLLLTHDANTLSALKSSCTIHIIELSYCSDASYDATLTRKQSQHHLLVSLLLSEGWTLANTSPPPHMPSHLRTTAPICIPSISVLSPPSSIPPASPLPLPVTLAHHVHILLFTHSCTIPKTLVSLLSSFSIPPSNQHDLLCALATHSYCSFNA